MLNKNTLFSGVYAIALFAAIMSCIGILNELLNLVQLCDKEILNLLRHQEDLLIPLVYLLVAFVLCLFTVIVLIMYVTNILKEKGFIFEDVVTNEDELVEGICKQLR